MAKKNQPEETTEQQLPPPLGVDDQETPPGGDETKPAADETPPGGDETKPAADETPPAKVEQLAPGPGAPESVPAAITGEPTYIAAEKAGRKLAEKEQRAAVEAIEEQARRPRQGELIIICPRDGNRCYAGTSGSRDSYFTRYYCSDPTCTYSEKIAKPDIQRKLERDRSREQDFGARP